MRPCGSAAKPISTYAPALDQGIITGASTIDDYPVLELNDSAYPKNDNGTVPGSGDAAPRAGAVPDTCSRAGNMMLGTWESYDFMTSRLGFTSLTQADSEQVGAMALGGYARGVTTEEMAAGLRRFCQRGHLYPSPYLHPCGGQQRQRDFGE